MSQVRLVNKLGLKGLKIKTKDAIKSGSPEETNTKPPVLKQEARAKEVVKKEQEEFTATKKIVDDNKIIPEILIIGKKTTFRSKIFVYTEGEIICEKSIPPELISEKKLEMAIIRESPLIKKQTLIIKGVIAEWKPPVRKIKLEPMDKKLYAQFLEFFK